MIKKMICIVCPNGCSMEVEEINNEVFVRGNLCPRGKEYAINELISPRRNIASTVKVKNGVIKVVPVYTAEKIGKEKIFTAMEIIRNLEVEAPVLMDEIVYSDDYLILKASCNVERRK